MWMRTMSDRDGQARSWYMPNVDGISLRERNPQSEQMECTDWRSTLGVKENEKQCDITR